VIRMTVMKKSNKDDAVSPVIGVMLMLVVTIVIAAVVAAFASGLGGDVESAPAAVFDVGLDKNGNLKLQHLSGENLIEKSISAKVQNAEGEILLKGQFTADGFFSPGETTSITLTSVNSGSVDTGDYVKVVILYDGKHVILNKDIMVN